MSLIFHGCFSRKLLSSYSNSASVLFTNYDLIWFQVHEMLRIEKGGEEQIGDELAAYKDMIREYAHSQVDKDFRYKNYALKKSLSKFCLCMCFHSGVSNLKLKKIGLIH